MLGFLLPKLAWFALFALAPIAIHLLNRIRLRRVEFSSLQFLHEVRRERFNWLRLKELLLLVLRTAFLLFLFLGLSRPFLKKGIFGARREVSAVLIIDDSYSMQYGSHFEQAQQAARSYLDRLAGSSEATLLTASTAQSLNPSILQSLLSRDLKSVGSAIDSLEPTYSAADLAPAVELARAMLDKAILPTREIVIFSDLQERALAPVSRSVNPSIGKSINSAVSVLVRDCGSETWQNSSVSDIASREHLPQPGTPAPLFATIEHFSNSDEVRSLTLSTDGSTETRSITLSEHVEKPVDFETQLFESGEHVVTAALDPDSLPADDRRFLVMDIPSRIAVLVVGDTPEDTVFPARALAPDTTGFFRVTTRLSAALRTADLSRFRAVVLANPVLLSAFDWQRVAEYVGQGGSVMVALAREPKDKSFLTQFVSWVGEGKPTGFVTIEKVDFTHPALDVFKDHSDFSLPRFFQYARLSPVNARVVASLTDGSPYLLEAGSGRVLIMASDFRLQDNDLPFKAVFVPLMHRLLSYLAREGARRDFLVGDAIITDAPAIGVVAVKTPDAEYSIVPENSTGRRSVRFSATLTPGIYRIADQAYAVNLLAEEGDLTRISEADLTRKGMSLLRDVRGKTSDLTNAFLVVAALALISEMLLLII